MSEVRTELPKGWAVANLGDIVDRLQYGFTTKSSADLKEPKLLRITDIKQDGVDWNTVPGCDISEEDLVKYRLADGDMVFARSGSIEKAFRVSNPPESVFASYLIRGRPIEKSMGSLLEHFVKTRDYLNQIGTFGSGIAIQNVNAKKLSSIRIPVPPLNEQKRIVARIEQLQVHSQRARETLEGLPDLLEQLRQSLLAAAFRGELTKEWRKKNPDVEPASELLKRTHTEGHKHWEEAEVEKLKAKGLIGEKLDEEFSKRRKQYREPNPVDTAGLPELPETWCWVSIDDMSIIVTKGSSPNWQGFEYIPKGIPFIRSQNVLSGELNLSELAFLPEKFNEKERKSILLKNDVLANIVGASIGRAALVTEEAVGGNVNQAVAVIRLVPEGLLPSLLVNWLLSPKGQYQIHAGKVEVARANLSLGDVSRIALPLPPIQEQGKLLEYLSEGMKIVHGFRETIISLTSRLDELNQSILAEAFRGELIPQDPNDEPASVLLEHIRQEKARNTAERKTSFERGMTMKLKEDEQRKVLTVLQQAKQAMTPEEIFMACGFDEESVDIFYEQLRHAVVGKQIRETRDGDSITLEMVKP